MIVESLMYSKQKRANYERDIFLAIALPWKLFAPVRYTD